MSKLSITPMRPEYVNQVHEICCQSFTDPWSKQSIISELYQPATISLVALLNNHVVGYLNARHLFKEGDLNLIVVRKEFQRNSIGTILMQALLQYAESEGISSYMLEVRESSIKAISFYRRFGFIQVGVRKDYYQKPNENAVLMRKELSYFRTDKLPNLN